jgi:hypothetical protein
MRIAIRMRSFEAECTEPVEVGPDESPADCFAEFNVENTGGQPVAANEADPSADTVQVTVVLRGKRDELENPALGLTNLILGTLRSHRSGNSNGRDREVIDAMGIAVEKAC